MPWKQQVRRFEVAFNYANSDHWQTTESLKNRIAAFRAQHPNYGLSMALFDPIVDWKLRKQRGRTESRRDGLTEPLLACVTGCAFTVQHRRPEVLASVQVGILASLPGVGVGLATAILALTFPEVHGVIDFRVWMVVFQEDKQSFTAQDYVRYLSELRPFAQEAGWSIQKADFMVWSFYDELTSASTRTRRKRRAAQPER